MGMGRVSGKGGVGVKGRRRWERERCTKIAQGSVWIPDRKRSVCACVQKWHERVWIPDRKRNVRVHIQKWHEIVWIADRWRKCVTQKWQSGGLDTR